MAAYLTEGGAGREAEGPFVIHDISPRVDGGCAVVFLYLRDVEPELVRGAWRLTLGRQAMNFESFSGHGL